MSQKLQVLLYSKCRRNGSSGFRHSLSYAAFFSEKFISCSAQQQSGFSFNISKTKEGNAHFQNISYTSIPFLRQICDLFSFIIKLKFLSFHKYGVLLKTSVHVNKPDIHTFYLAFWRKCADRRIQIQTKPVLTLCY